MNARVPSHAGFTLVELLTVITIIIVLAGLTVQISGYVQRKGAMARAQAEVAAMEAALESYRADNGIYPSDAATDALDAQTSTNPSGYQSASLLLYKELSGDSNADGQFSDTEKGNKTYFEFPDNMLAKNGDTVLYVQDPFGFSYGYSTIQQSGGDGGFNPTIDLWSTGGKNLGSDVDKANWLTNWN